MSSPFDTARANALLPSRGGTLGRPLQFVDVTTSTNDDALEAARAGAPHGATFVADLQTAGRGRRGARWSAPAGDDLTFSVLLRPKLEPASASALTLAIGLAVRAACARRVSAPVSLKWPNDLWVLDRKLAGILVESTLHAGRPSAVVAGVGINVCSREFPPDLAHPATSLALLDAESVDRAELLVDVLSAISERVDAFERDGLSSMLEEFERHDALAGRRVEVDGRVGVAAGISASGALRMRCDDGTVADIATGTVRIV